MVFCHSNIKATKTDGSVIKALAVLPEDLSLILNTMLGSLQFSITPAREWGY